MVIYIDGACRDNGKPIAKASYGVYFGSESPYNTCGLLPNTLPQTSNRTEIEALRQAVNIIQAITDNDFKLSRIKIATDSSFLAKAMSEHIEGWMANGGKGSRGKPVAHFDVLKEMHEKMDYMEYSDDGGREIEFWLVPRGRNTEANALARRALDEA